MNKFEYILTENDKDIPIKKIMRREFGFSSRLMTKIKQNKSAYLNGESLPGWVTGDAGDVLTVMLPEETSDFEPEPIPISPVYEDNDLLIINKQPGICGAPHQGAPAHTIANGLMQYLIDTEQKFKIRFINRLDMDTSGLLIIAKNSHAQDSFMKQMKANTIRKKYIAVVKGIIPENEGTIDLPIGRPDPDRVERWVMTEGGYPSVTHYSVIERFKNHTLVRLILETGRTHQIRVHMAYTGHPVLGDHLYGGENPLLIERQALHSQYLSFNHPVSDKRIDVEAPLHDDMLKLIEKLRK